MAMTKTRIIPPLKYHGGKYYLADWIISHFPEHTQYVEPYFGGGHVFLRREPAGVSEAINDVSPGLMAFWLVLQDPTAFEVFKRKCHATPFDECTFSRCKETWRQHYHLHGTFVEDERNPVRLVDLAWAFFVCVRQSRQGLMKDFATISRNRTRGGMNEQASAYWSSIEGLPDAHRRLRGAALFCQDACPLIRSLDSRRTLFYCDPTYLPETRTARKAYDFEMTPEQHEELLTELSKIEGKFLLSGYDSAMYRRYARKHRWRVRKREIDAKSSSAKTKGSRVECLWMNFDPPRRRRVA